MAQVIENLTCPHCGGTITENDKAYGCSNWRDADGACKFKVWKESFGRAISLEEVSKIITEGKSDLLDGFISKKTGNPYSAFIVVNPSEEQYPTKLEFPNQ